MYFIYFVYLYETKINLYKELGNNYKYLYALLYFFLYLSRIIMYADVRKQYSDIFPRWIC